VLTTPSRKKFVTKPHKNMRRPGFFKNCRATAEEEEEEEEDFTG
jgi:hypothetical protein